MTDRGRAFPAGSPAAAGYAMPPEWAPHARTWMAYPHAVYPGAGTLSDARGAWGAVARAVARFEPVSLLVDFADRDAARADLGDVVDVVPVALDDGWARDSGPTFVAGPAGVAAVTWRFNGWGQQAWAQWNHDARVGAAVAENAGVPRFAVDLVNEGGGIEVDGSGRVLLTDTVQRDPERNPGLSRGEVEVVVNGALGTAAPTWLARGLSGDYGPYGTRGHVDLVAKFVAPGVAAVHDQRDESHPDFAVSAATRAALTTAGCAVVPVPAPRATAGEPARDWSYVNCYVVNDGVVVGTFDDPCDDEAVATFSTLFPGRTVVTVDARPLFALGGGVHCVTQQQPR